MKQLFLFSDHLTDSSCLGVLIENNLLLNSKIYLLTEISSLQMNEFFSVTVVMPGNWVSLHEIESVWLSYRKARTVLPFILEEKLAEEITELHLAFDKQHYHNPYYLVAVCKRAYLTHILQALETYSIKCAAITCEWFALKTQEIAVFSNRIAIRSRDFNGTLPMNFINSIELLPTVHTFKDSNMQVTKALQPQTFHDHFSYEWISLEISAKKFINFRQGEFEFVQKRGLIKYFWFTISGLLILNLFSFILINTLIVLKLNKKIAVEDQQIAAIYYQFFNRNQPVITPKFRLEQLLKQQNHRQSFDFWLILTKVLAKFNAFEIRQLNFQNQTLTLTLVSKDFKQLELLQKYLINQKLHVKVIQTNNQNNKIYSILELTL